MEKNRIISIFLSTRRRLNDDKALGSSPEAPDPKNSIILIAVTPLILSIKILHFIYFMSPNIVFFLHEANPIQFLFHLKYNYTLKRSYDLREHKVKVDFLANFTSINISF